MLRLGINDCLTLYSEDLWLIVDPAAVVSILWIAHESYIHFLASIIALLWPYCLGHGRHVAVEGYRISEMVPSR